MRSQTDVSLADLTTLRLGGPARRLLEVENEQELIEAVRASDDAAEPLLVLAGGSNVVIADEGFAGTVVRIATRGVATDEFDGRVRLTVQAGEDWDALVSEWVAEGLVGVECLVGIPGSVGATPIQNVGAYGQDVSETVVGVRVYDRATGEIAELLAAECGFGYRTSAFRDDDRRIVLSVTFELERSDVSRPVRYGELARALGIAADDSAPAAAVREAVLELRRAKGMVLDARDPDTVSAGSFFKNPLLAPADFEALERRVGERLGGEAVPPRFPDRDGRVKTSAAWLIERAGFERGHVDGRAAISTKHTLALVNRGGATTAELVDLAREIAAGVREAFGIALMPEPTFVGVEW